jgi:hypothetical protein
VIAVILIFISIPYLHYLVKKEIEIEKKEKILFKIKEKPMKKEIILFSTIIIVILFFLNPGIISYQVAVMKILFVIAMYTVEDFMKTKIVFTTKNVYLIQKFKNKHVMYIKKFKDNEIYYIGLKDRNSEVYEIYFSGKNNFASRINFKLGKNGKEIFTKLLRERMNLELPRIENNNIEKRKPQKDYSGVFMKVIIWLSVILTGYVGINEITNKNIAIRHLFASILLVQVIPFSLVVFSYMFLKTSGLLKDLHDKLNNKMIMFYILVGTAFIAFFPFRNHNMIEYKRILLANFIGISLFALVMMVAWIVGKVVKQKIKKQTQ